jgi:hypothetical protein
LFLGSPNPFDVHVEEDLLPDDCLDLDIFAINTGCEDILVPKLENLEVSTSSQTRPSFVC